MKKDTYIKGAALAAMGGVFWALAGTFGQFLFECRNFDAEWLTSVRLISAGLIMLMICAMKEKKRFFDIWKTKRDAVEVIIYGLVGMLGVQITYLFAIQYSNAATGTIVQYTGSAMIVVYLAVRHLKLPNRYEVAAVILAIAGIFVLSTHGDVHNFVISKEALAWGLTSAVLMAFYSIFPRRMLARFGTLCTNGWGMTIGGLVLLLFRQPWDLGGGTLDFSAVMAAAGVVVFGTILSFFCYLDGVRLIGSTKAVLYACVEPLTAAIIGILWFHIPFGLIDWFGAALIVSTVFIISLAPKEKEPEDGISKDQCTTNASAPSEKRS